MSALTDYLNKFGRMPPVELLIQPIERGRDPVRISQFLSYSFQSSILIPVDTFQFTFSMPSSTAPLDEVVREGDIAVLQANGFVLATGIVDMVDIETTKEGGDIATIVGRDLMGQLEDQSCVSSTDEPIFAKNGTLASVVKTLIANTRIKGLSTQGGNPRGLFATEPGESKLSALQRFVEPFNVIAWMDPNGYIVVGKPNMGQPSLGKVHIDSTKRAGNMLSMKATRASTQIPNIVIPIWTGQEIVTKRVAKEQRLLNSSSGPTRLRKAGHLVQKAIVVSTPQGSDPQSLSGVNFLVAGGSNLLQAHAVREVARANVQELIVQANAPGHYNDDLIPFQVDQVYDVYYPRASVEERMYLYQVSYTGSASEGPRTNLSFCKLGRIVANVPTTPAARTNTKRGVLG